jgi:hypothetical protein
VLRRAAIRLERRERLDRRRFLTVSRTRRRSFLLRLAFGGSTKPRTALRLFRKTVLRMAIISPFGSTSGSGTRRTFLRRGPTALRWEIVHDTRDNFRRFRLARLYGPRLAARRRLRIRQSWRKLVAFSLGNLRCKSECRRSINTRSFRRIRRARRKRLTRKACIGRLYGTRNLLAPRRL